MKAPFGSRLRWDLLCHYVIYVLFAFFGWCFITRKANAWALDVLQDFALVLLEPKPSQPKCEWYFRFADVLICHCRMSNVVNKSCQLHQGEFPKRKIAEKPKLAGSQRVVRWGQVCPAMSLMRRCWWGTKDDGLWMCIRNVLGCLDHSEKVFSNLGSFKLRWVLQLSLKSHNARSSYVLQNGFLFHWFMHRETELCSNTVLSLEIRHPFEADCISRQTGP